MKTFRIFSVSAARSVFSGSLHVRVAQIAALGTATLYLASNEAHLAESKVSTKVDTKVVDYDAVRNAITAKLDAPNYDDGSYGPLFVRLAWHASGTYSAEDKSGGSNGGRIRFAPECEWGANAGLKLARQILEPIKAAYPGISYADLYTLAGAVAIEEMGGPKIRWRPGRVDFVDGKSSPKDGRLPDAAQEQDHVRKVFGRMGFNDRETVALIGAHAMGRCHTDRSGYSGPWTNAPTTFSNEYFRLLVEEQWQEKQWKGPKQFENTNSGKNLMMLPADLALLKDPLFRKYVEFYAKNEKVFSEDFADAFAKLLELGVPFAEDQKPWFKFW